jgi:regulator of protease activity HflC (stomatin/prohibitin superfamily)
MFGLRIGVALVLVCAGFAVFNKGLILISSPSDLAVWEGVMIMIGYAVAAAYLGRWIFSRVKMRSNSTGMMLLLAIAGASFFSTGCAKTIPPGHVGIVVNQYGSQKGVADFPLKTGRVWYNPWSETVFDYPVYVQRAIWTKSLGEGRPQNEEVSFNSKEGMGFTGDILFSYHLVESKVSAFYVKFRSDDLERFTHGFMRDDVRDILNESSVHFGSDEIIGVGKEVMLKEVRDRLNVAMEAIGVVLDQFGFISAPRPPESVQEAINAKQKATQDAIRAENELRTARAEAQKVIASGEGTASATIS